MTHKPVVLMITALLLISCNAKKNIGRKGPYNVKLDTLTMLDTSRNRNIPVAFYSPDKTAADQQVVIFNHGYGGNKGGDYLMYSHLTKTLASKGYFTMSIQHELPTDDLLPLEGNLQVARRPFWERLPTSIMDIWTIKVRMKRKKC